MVSNFTSKLIRIMIVLELQNKIERLKLKLTGKMMEDLEVQEEIRGLQRQLDILNEPLPDKPNDSPFECDNCGS